MARSRTDEALSRLAPAYCDKCHDFDPAERHIHWAEMPIDVMRAHVTDVFGDDKNGRIEALVGWRYTLAALYRDRCREDGTPLSAEQFWIETMQRRWR